MPTSAQDPERARLQRRQWLQTQAPETLNESDWRGLLIGLACAIGTVLALIALIRVFIGAGVQ